MWLEYGWHLQSHANGRGHWSVKAKAISADRAALRLAWYASGRPVPPAWPVRVTLTRIAPRALDDDNIRGAFKGIRDELAEGCWGLSNDRGPEVVWCYEQRRGAAGEYAVRVEVEAMGDG